MCAGSVGRSWPSPHARTSRGSTVRTPTACSSRRRSPSRVTSWTAGWRAERMAPPALPPRLVAATERQLEAWRAALAGGAERVGWKLGLRIAEIESVIGTQPAIGHLTTATVLADGAAHSAAGARELRAETELVVEGAGAGGSAAGHAVCLELVAAARPPADLEGIVAANVLHRAAVLGPTLPGAMP